MFFHRHWVIICAGFVCGAVLSKTQWITWALLPIISLILILFLIVSYQKKIRYVEGIGIFLFSLIIGALSYLLHPYPEEGDDFFLWLRQQPPNAYVEVEGYVTENTLFDPTDRQIQFVIHILKVKNGSRWENIVGKALVSCKDAQYPIFTHTRVHLFGKTSLYLSAVNESLSDYETYLRSHRIYTKIFTYAPQIKIIHTYTLSPFFHLSRLQQYFYERIIQYTPTSIKDMTRAIWLGDRSGLDYKEKQNFVLTGTIHILAISGLHVGLVFWFTRALMRTILKTRRRWADVPALLLCILYALISGAHGSSLRAVLMLIVYELYLWNRKNEDILTALCITVTLLFIFNTDLIWDMGTQMSILAVASILLFNEPLLKLLRIFPWTIRNYLSVAISGQVLLLPLLAITNLQINILSPIYNLLVIPLITLYLMTSICGLALIFVPLIPALFFYISGVFLILIQSLCKWGGSFSYTIFPISHPSPLAIFLYFVVCIFLYHWLITQKRKAFFMFIAGCMILIFFWTGVPFYRETTVYILDVGHGDAILITTAEKENILVDGGTKRIGEQIVVPFLFAKGIRRLDYVVATHADEDHIGGIFNAMDKLQVRHFIYGEGFADTELGNEMIKKAIFKNINLIKAKDGLQIKLTKNFLNILYAGRPYYYETNENSLVLKFVNNHFSVLLTGDFPAKLTEKELFSTDCYATIIKIPHHGLKNSLNQELLEKSQPKIAVVSVNEFQHNWGVRNEVKDLLHQYQIPLWRTDYYGGITIQSNGDKINIYGARQKKGYFLRKEGHS